VEKWEHYSPNKYDLFQKENLAVKSEAVAKKFYTMAHNLRLELALVALLENWLEKGWISILLYIFGLWGLEVRGIDEDSLYIAANVCSWADPIWKVTFF
jgi:hypothetical protein